MNVQTSVLSRTKEKGAVLLVGAALVAGGLKGLSLLWPQPPLPHATSEPAARAPVVAPSAKAPERLARPAPTRSAPETEAAPAVQPAEMPAAPPDVRQRIAEAMARNSGGQAVVVEVNQTPLPGLFEVATSKRDVFYTDGEGRFALIDGHLIDTRLRVDHTARRQDVLNRVDFSTLPLDLAIRTGNGSRQVVVFEDPACPNCRIFAPILASMPDVTVYHMPYPIVGPDSPQVTKTAWCSPVRAQIWARLMAGAQMQPDSQVTCDASAVDHFLDLGEQLGIQATPTVILSNGKRLVGAVSPERLMEAITMAEIEVSEQRAEGRAAPRLARMNATQVEASQ